MCQYRLPRLYPAHRNQAPTLRSTLCHAPARAFSADRSSRVLSLSSSILVSHILPSSRHEFQGTSGSQILIGLREKLFHVRYGVFVNGLGRQRCRLRCRERRLLLMLPGRPRCSVRKRRRLWYGPRRQSFLILASAGSSSEAAADNVNSLLFVAR